MVKKKENERMDAARLAAMAEDYRRLALQVKDLEAKIKPIKDAIVAECKAQGLTGTLDLDAILVVSQVRTTQKINQAALSPDWLYRFQTAGGHLTAKLDVEPQQFDGLADLLAEVGFAESASQSYVLKLKAQ